MSVVISGSERLMGAHMPTAGGMYNSLLSGKEIGCTAVQLFTSSPRQWQSPPLSEETIRAFQDARESTGIPFACAHDSYLINLAAPTEEVMEKSRIAFRAELERAEQLGLSWVVTHMGAHLNQGEEAAMARLVESLRLILDETDALGYSVGVALETTAGQGSGLGWRFEQIGQILRGVGAHPRLGVCMDTCHIFVAGYDLRDAASYETTITEFDAQIGLNNLKIIHANDAKKPLGSRVDRHEHIGEGEIGVEGFAQLVRDPRLSHIPVIVETPESETMHAVNLRRLRCLAAGRTMHMQVQVQFFGHYRDFYAEPLTLELRDGATIQSLAELLSQKDDRLTGLTRSCRFAVAEEYVTADAVLTDACVIAVLPPMSGG